MQSVHRFDGSRQYGIALIDRLGQRDKPRAKGKTGDELHLPPLALIQPIAALVSPPRQHRRRYFGLLRPNWPHRAAAVALAQDAAVQLAQMRTEPASTGEGEGEGELGVSNPLPTQRKPTETQQSCTVNLRSKVKQSHRHVSAHELWSIKNPPAMNCKNTCEHSRTAAEWSAFTNPIAQRISRSD